MEKTDVNLYIGRHRSTGLKFINNIYGNNQQED